MSNTRKAPEPFSPLSELIPDSRNANKGNVRGTALLEDSLRKHGAGRSILLDRNNRVIAGNKTLEGAASIGLEDVQIIESDGRRLIAVKRTDIDLETPEGRELALLDNRTSEVNLEWDVEVLAQFKDEGVDLSGLWNDDELEELLESGGGGGIIGDPDEIPENVETRCKAGDLWLLGSHRLLCGDSTKAEDVGRLMGGKTARCCVTDPPYGVNYGNHGNARWGAHSPIANDNLSEEGMAAFWVKVFCAIAPFVEGDLYVAAPAGPPNLILASSLAQSPFEHHQWLIWVKDQLVLGRSNYHYRHEHLWYGWKKGKTSSWCAGRDQDSVWLFDRPKVSVEHPTMKPVDLMAKAIGNSSNAKQVILDPFLGSGTTLIAAEQLGRKCYGLEIEPKYCDVIIQRFENATGKTAELVEHGRVG